MKMAVILHVIVFDMCTVRHGRPGSSVRIATDYGLDGPGSNHQWTHFGANPNPLWHQTRMPTEHGTFRNVHPTPLTTAGPEPSMRATATD